MLNRAATDAALNPKRGAPKRATGQQIAFLQLSTHKQMARQNDKIRHLNITCEFIATLPKMTGPDGFH